MIKAELGPAVFSKNRYYRYKLTREWNVKLPCVAWIGLNPSTADEEALDNTLRRCVNFSAAWGYGSFVMLNLFALRTKDPAVMKNGKNPVGRFNDTFILATCEAIIKQDGKVIACWGTHGKFMDRGETVRTMLDSRSIPLHNIGLNGDGSPCHPLYLPNGLEPQAWPR